MSSLEPLEVRGHAYERGIAHGKEVADALESNVDIYRRQFEHEGLSTATVRDLVAGFLELIEDENEAHAREMRGMADGRSNSMTELTMLNVRWEIIYAAWKESATGVGGGGTPIDGCTSHDVTPEVTADGKMYI